MAKKKTVKPSLLKGTIRLHPRGFGFVLLKQPFKGAKEVFIPKRFTKGSIDGDQIELALFSEEASEKGFEGEVVAILERGKQNLVGIVEDHNEGKAIAHSLLLGTDKPIWIEGNGKKFKVGEIYLIEVTNWGGEGKDQGQVEGKAKKKLGDIEDPTSDIPSAVSEYQIRSSFPKSALDMAAGFGKTVGAKDRKDRLDLTNETCFTIDPDTAKDFDDALSIQVDRKGNFALGVHIADVAHYIKPNTALDIEAKRRSNSTYFPSKCIPMIPQSLSNELCSLKQGVFRLCVSVLMKFDKNGNLIKGEVKRSFIKSKKRFTYDQALSIVEEKTKSPYAEQIKQMEQLCNLLKQKRRERGSVDFALPELILLMDNQGMPQGVKIEPYHITHQMVEEFMLKANEVVAIELEKRGKTQLFRVHEEPAEKNLTQFFTHARALGFPLPQNPDAQDIQKLFDKARSTHLSTQLAIGFIRTLKIATYSPQNVGHYGLALEHYCHFTSPIRRYSDLITQRLLFNEEGEEPPFEEIAKDCSEKERISFRAETSVKQLKKLRLLKAWSDEDPDRFFAAHITKVKPFGISFEIDDLFFEGFLHISAIASDYLVYQPKQDILFAEKSGFTYRVGTTLSVRPHSINLIHRTVEWETHSKALPKKSDRKEKRPRKRAKRSRSS